MGRSLLDKFTHKVLFVFSPSLPPLSFCTFFLVSCATLTTASLSSIVARARTRPLAPTDTVLIFLFRKDTVLLLWAFRVTEFSYFYRTKFNIVINENVLPRTSKSFSSLSLGTIVSFKEMRMTLIREKRESAQKRLNSGEITVNYTGGEVARVV